MGMNKADLASRVTRAEQLMNKYADENDRLDQENDALRGGKQLLEMEHAQALEQVTELTERLNSLEHTFLNDPDGTRRTRSGSDGGARTRCTRRFRFPGSSAKRSLGPGEQTHRIRTGRGGAGAGEKPCPSISARRGRNRMHLVLLFHVFAFAAPPLLPDSPDTGRNASCRTSYPRWPSMRSARCRLHPRFGRRVGALGRREAYRTSHAALSTFSRSVCVSSSTSGCPNCTPSIAATIRRRALAAAFYPAPQAPPCAHPPPPPNPRAPPRAAG